MFTSLPPHPPHLPLNRPPACCLRRLDRGGAAHALGLNRLFLLFLIPVQVRAALSSGSNSGAATLPPYHHHSLFSLTPLADDGKATRALQSSLADAKVEVEFWKRKVRALALHLLPIRPNFGCKVDDLSTRLTESQIERRCAAPNFTTTHPPLNPALGGWKTLRRLPLLEPSSRAPPSTRRPPPPPPPPPMTASASARWSCRRVHLTSFMGHPLLTSFQLKNLQHSIDMQTSKALHVKACVSNTGQNYV
jgi:hypothetical protein